MIGVLGFLGACDRRYWRYWRCCGRLWALAWLLNRRRSVFRRLHFHLRLVGLRPVFQSCFQLIGKPVDHLRLFAFGLSIEQAIQRCSNIAIVALALDGKRLGLSYEIVDFLRLLGSWLHWLLGLILRLVNHIIRHKPVAEQIHLIGVSVGVKQITLLGLGAASDVNTGWFDLWYRRVAKQAELLAWFDLLVRDFLGWLDDSLRLRCWYRRLRRWKLRGSWYGRRCGRLLLNLRRKNHIIRGRVVSEKKLLVRVSASVKKALLLWLGSRLVVRRVRVFVPERLAKSLSGKMAGFHFAIAADQYFLTAVLLAVVSFLGSNCYPSTACRMKQTWLIAEVRFGFCVAIDRSGVWRVFACCVLVEPSRWSPCILTLPWLPKPRKILQ